MIGCYWATLFFWRGREPHRGPSHGVRGVELNLHVEAYSCENRQQAKHYSMVESEVVWKNIFRGPGSNYDRLGDKNK